MKEITIDGRNYTLIYTFRAARYEDCAGSVLNIMYNVSAAESKEDVKALIAEMTELPNMTTKLFYAGLLQHHGTHAKGDGTVPSIDTAMDLLDTYIEEQISAGQNISYYSLMNDMIDCMSDDGFFKLTGLEDVIRAGEAEEEPKKSSRTRKKTKEATA